MYDADTIALAFTTTIALIKSLFGYDMVRPESAGTEIVLYGLDVDAEGYTESPVLRYNAAQGLESIEVGYELEDYDEEDEAHAALIAFRFGGELERLFAAQAVTDARHAFYVAQDDFLEGFDDDGSLVTAAERAYKTAVARFEAL
jgi:hypothetical protein